MMRRAFGARAWCVILSSETGTDYFAQLVAQRSGHIQLLCR
jgi:hypothetical protein